MKYTKEKWKGAAILGPVPPVLVTCGDVASPNVLTIAWTGILNTIPPKTYISVRPERFSYGLIKESGEFVINLPVKELVRAVDFCGVRSGATVNKLEEMKLEYEPATEVNTVMLCQSPISLECRVEKIIPLGSHDMFIANIVAVNAGKELLDSKGKMSLDKAELLAYAHGEYYVLGEKLGSFGYSVKRKKKRRR